MLEFKVTPDNICSFELFVIFGFWIFSTPGTDFEQIIPPLPKQFELLRTGFLTKGLPSLAPFSKKYPPKTLVLLPSTIQKNAKFTKPLQYKHILDNQKKSIFFFLSFFLGEGAFFCIGVTIRISWKIQCLLYTWFFLYKWRENKL